jgi:hypothetical protein
MSELKAFFKKNKTATPNIKYAATKSLTDEKGEPLLWELKALTTKENDAITDASMKQIPISGKRGQYRHSVDATLYQTKLICASVVFPDLYNKELQDSYGVKTPEDLVKEMIDNPAEWTNLIFKVQELSGFDDVMDDDIEHAKN